MNRVDKLDWWLAWSLSSVAQYYFPAHNWYTLLGSIAVLGAVLLFIYLLEKELKA